MDNDGWPDVATGASVGDGIKPAIWRHAGTLNGIPRFIRPAGLFGERTATPEISQWEKAEFCRYWPTAYFSPISPSNHREEA